MSSIKETPKKKYGYAQPVLKVQTSVLGIRTVFLYTLTVLKIPLSIQKVPKWINTLSFCYFSGSDFQQDKHHQGYHQ